MVPPKIRPRYLPTLTQVVTEAELLHPRQDAGPDQKLPPSSRAANKVQELVDLILPKLMYQMQQELQENMDLQLHRLEVKMRGELEVLVRHATNGGGTFPAP